MEDIVTINQSDTDEISFKEIKLKLYRCFRYLLSKWILIVTFVSIGSILGYIYASLKKPEYNATTTFVLETGEGNALGGQYAGIASMVGIDVGESGGGIFQGDNILELYKSRSMIKMALLSKATFEGKSELLIDRYIESNDLRKSWTKKPELKNISFSEESRYRQTDGLSRLQDSIITTIVADINKRYLTVEKPDKKLSIIRVDVKAEDEFFAKSFNDMIVKTVNDFYVQTKTKKALQNVNILKEKVDSVRASLNGSIYSSAVIADATPNLNPSRQVQRVVPMQRSQVNAETNRLILGELVKNLELSNIGLLKETPLIQVVDQPVFPLYKERFGKSKGIILGGLLFGFLITFALIIRKITNRV